MADYIDDAIEEALRIVSDNPEEAVRPRAEHEQVRLDHVERNAAVHAKRARLADLLAEAGHVAVDGARPLQEVEVGRLFVPEAGGRFEIIATAADAEGRPNRTTVPVWVAGGVLPPQVEGVEQQDIVLVPDAETYRPGDVAEVLVQAPFAPAEGPGIPQPRGALRADSIRRRSSSPP